MQINPVTHQCIRYYTSLHVANNFKVHMKFYNQRPQIDIANLVTMGSLIFAAYN